MRCSADRPVLFGAAMTGEGAGPTRSADRPVLFAGAGNRSPLFSADGRFVAVAPVGGTRWLDEGLIGLFQTRLLTYCELHGILCMREWRDGRWDDEGSAGWVCSLPLVSWVVLHDLIRSGRKLLGFWDEFLSVVETG